MFSSKGTANGIGVTGKKKKQEIKCEWYQNACFGYKMFVLVKKQLYVHCLFK